MIRERSTSPPQLRRICLGLIALPPSCYWIKTNPPCYSVLQSAVYRESSFVLKVRLKGS